jgi:hypothetical protein
LNPRTSGSEGTDSASEKNPGRPVEVTPSLKLYGQISEEIEICTRKNTS